MIRPADNPFNAQRISTLPYQPVDHTWPAILDRLEELRYRAAVVGPHGSGKSTFLRSLHTALETRGFDVRHHRLRRDARCVPPVLLENLTNASIVLLDSAGCLSPFRWHQVRRASGAGRGLVISAHRPGRLPTLLRTRAEPELFGRLVDGLIGRPQSWPRDVLAGVLRRHRGNMRDAFRELYDQSNAT